MGGFTEIMENTKIQKYGKDIEGHINISKDQTSVINKPEFKENWCGLMVFSGMYSGFLRPIVNVTISFIHFIFLMVTCYHSLRIDFDLTLFSGSIHYTLMMCSACASLVNCQARSAYIDEIIRCIEEDFHDYEDTIDPETKEIVENERASMKQRKHKVAKFYVVLFALAGIISMIIFPFIFVNPSLEKDDIINRNLPVPAYYIWKTDTWPRFLVSLCGEYWVAYIILSVVSGTDICFSCFTEEGVFQLKKLALTLRHSQRRASYLFKKKYNQEVKNYRENKYVECLKICLNHSVKHHYKIIRYFKDVGKHYFYMLLIIMLGSTFLLCLSGILFVSDQVETGTKLQFLAYMITVLFHTFTFTWYGDMVSYACGLVRQNIYEAEWQVSSKEFKSYMIIMMANLNRPIELNVGGFMICNLKTFGSVLSSSYSYFNLLSVMMARGEDNKISPK